jgi:hypothetical protein
VTTASIGALDAKAEQQLINRVLTSRHFIKAPLLSAFLAYVCRRALEDGAARILEHEIGVNVFGRDEGYDSREDNIVRNYARQLRRRLDEYYSTDGRAERLRVDIPKGGYVPLFTLNQSAVINPGVPGEFEQNDSALRPLSVRSRSLYLRAAIFVAVAFLLMLFGVAFYALQHRKSAPPTVSTMHPLWRQLFLPNKDIFFVPADTAFVTLQDIQKRTFSLAEYVSWSAVEQPKPSFISDLKTRKYTSVVAMETISRLEHLPEAIPDHCLIRTVRSLTLEDMKNGNMILLGSIYSIPWIEVVQNELNFHFVYKPQEGRAWIENRSPAPGEAATYQSAWNGPAEKTFAVLAFIPNLRRSGHILLIQGLDGAGTEATDSLLFREGGLDEVFAKARRPDGTLGNFEALLESTSVDSHATSIRILAIRRPD